MHSAFAYSKERSLTNTNVGSVIQVLDVRDKRLVQGNAYPDLHQIHFIPGMC